MELAPELALFDLDNTLLSGDSDHAWAQFLIDRGILEREGYAARNDRFYAQYKAGTLDIYEFLDFQLAPLAQHPRAQLDAWHAEFMQERIQPIIRSKGLALVQQHQQQGALCALVTATNSFVTAPIAAAFGIAHLIATEPEHKDGQFTGRPLGTPSFREGKVSRMNDWLQAQGKRWDSFPRSWFYSDSNNDLPLLEHVTDPVAVDPDDTLRRIAEQRQWPVISLA